MIVSGLIAPCVVAQSPPEAISFISSRFMLWDDSEKMLDGDFIVHIIEFNQTVNSTNFYKVILDGNERTGYFENYIELNYSIKTDRILSLEVWLNNETLLKANNINILSGLSSSGISSSSSPFTINLAPWEWTSKEWNIVSSIVLSSLLAMFIGYRIAKRYRKLHGVHEVR